MNDESDAMRGRQLMWVKSHNEIDGNENVDERAKTAASIGHLFPPRGATPARIRQFYPSHRWNKQITS